MGVRNLGTESATTSGSSLQRPDGVKRGNSFLETAAETLGEDLEETPLLAREHESRSAGTPSGGWVGLVDFEGLPWYKTPHVFWLFGPFFLFTVAFGGMAVPRINILMTLLCREYLSDKSIADPTTPQIILAPGFGGDNDAMCNIPPVHAQMAQLNLIISLVSGLLSAITSPKIGALSDRYGRTKLIAFCTFGLLVGEIFMLMVANFPDVFPVHFVILGAVFDGLCGGFISVGVAAVSYATDCTPPRKRVVVFGVYHGLMAVGMAIGPIAVAYVVKWTGTLLSALYLALAAHLCFITLVLFVVPDSLSAKRIALAKEKHRIAKSLDNSEAQSLWARLRSFNLFEPLKILYPTGPGTSPSLRRNLMILASIDAICTAVLYGVISVVLIYIKFMFNWNNYEQSRYITIVSSFRVIILLFVLPAIVWFFRGRHRIAGAADHNAGSDLLDLTLIRAALFFDVIGYIGFCVSKTGWQFTLSAAIATFGAIGSASLQSALTKHVPQDRTGQLLGALGLLHAIIKIIAPATFNLIYEFTVGKFTQAVFVGLCALFATAHILSWFLRPHVYLEEQDPTERETPDESSRLI